MRISTASLALFAALCHTAFAQSAQPPSEPPPQIPPSTEQKAAPPVTQPGTGIEVGPALPPPPSPEATTPPNPLQVPPDTEVSPAAVPPAGPKLPQPVLPEPKTQLDTSKAPPPIEDSPLAVPPPAQPLLPPSATPPLQQQTASVSPETAAYLKEIGIDPGAPDVIEVSQDNVGAVSLDSLAAARDETRVRRFIYTRTFMHRFLADPDNVRIEPDKYDIAFLTPDEVNLISDLLNK